MLPCTPALLLPCSVLKRERHRGKIPSWGTAPFLEGVSTLMWREKLYSFRRGFLSEKRTCAYTCLSIPARLSNSSFAGNSCFLFFHFCDLSVIHLLRYTLQPYCTNVVERGWMVSTLKQAKIDTRQPPGLLPCSPTPLLTCSKKPVSAFFSSLVPFSIFAHPFSSFNSFSFFHLRGSDNILNRSFSY